MSLAPYAHPFGRRILTVVKADHHRLVADFRLVAKIYDYVNVEYDKENDDRGDGRNRFLRFKVHRAPVDDFYAQQLVYTY